MAQFSNGLAIINTTWSTFKSRMLANVLQSSLNYDIDTTQNAYQIFIVNNGVVLLCNIWIGAVPISATYLQAQNDADKADWETNYLSTANKQTNEPIRDRWTTGSLSALNQTIVTSSEGAGTVGIQITGTWVGNIAFEANIDGYSWFGLSAFPPGGAAAVTSTSTNGVWKINASGLYRLQVMATTWVSGTAYITFDVSAASSYIAVAQGAATSLANSWTTKITDAINGPVAVKPPSTAAAAADSALVVSLSPNSPITVSNQQPTPIQTNITLNSSGSLVVNVNMHDVPTNIVYYVAGPVTGTSPTLIFTCVDLDPQTNTTTSLTTSSGPTLTAVTAPGFFTHISRTGTFRLSWTITGTNPSFGGVYTTAVPRNEGGIGLSGYSAPNDTHSVGGKDPNGNLQPVSLAIEQSQYSAPAPNKQSVQTNATLTTSGSAIFSTYGAKEIDLFINVKNAPTGTTPTLTYTIQEVDPGDLITVNGSSATSTAISVVGVQTISLPVTKSPVVQVSWTVTGTTPSFTGVYATLVSKISGNVQLYDNTGAAISSSNPLSIGFTSPAGASISFGDVSLASVTTAAVERTTYTEQTANFTGSIVSSSANDTSAGTGARTVIINYIDQTGTTLTSTTYTLNGTTAVNLAATGMCFIESMTVSTVGTGSANAGTISLFTGTGGTGTLVATIGIGDNRTFWAHHYVIAGKTCKIQGTVLGSTSTTVGAGNIGFIKAKSIGSANKPETQVTDFLTLYGQSSMTTRNYTTAIPIAAGPSRIRAYVTTQSSTAQTYRFSFDYIDQ